MKNKRFPFTHTNKQMRRRKRATIKMHFRRYQHLKNTAILNMKWEKQRGNTNRK